MVSYTVTVIDEESYIKTYLNGSKEWYWKDKLHRLDAPAVENSDGSVSWYRNGIRHRDDGPAVIRDYKAEWWLDGQRHRLDGPAIEEADGTKFWFQNNKRHRIDGPAIEYVRDVRDSGQNHFWYYEDEPINCETQEEFERLIKLKAFW